MSTGAPHPVAWLSNVPAYVPGTTPPTGGLALASNEHWTTSSRVYEALAQLSKCNTYPSPLADDLREDLATLHGVHPDQVLVSNGSDELVSLLMTAYVGHGGHVVAADPPYAMTRVGALLTDATFTGVPLTQFCHDLTEIAKVHADLAYVVNPHNPTGTAHTGEAIAQFSTQARARLRVFDEAYIDFADDPDNCTALKQVDRGDTVVLRTFSKAYGLAAFRVGYAVASHDIIATLRTARAPFSVSTPAQSAARAALKDQEFLQTQLAQVRESRKSLCDALTRFGAHVPPSQANFVLACIPEAERVLAKLYAAGIAVRSGTVLGVPGSVRITVPAPEHLPRLIDALEHVLAPNM